VASLSQGRTAAAQCGLFTYKSVPVIFEPPCILWLVNWQKFIEVLPLRYRKKRNFQTFSLLSNVNHALGRCGLCDNVGIKEWRRYIIGEKLVFVFWFVVDIPSIVSGEELVPLRVIKEGTKLGYVRINILRLTENMLCCFFWVIPRCLNFMYRRFGTLSVPSSYVV